MTSTISSPLPTVALFGGTANTGLSFLTQFLLSSPNANINVLARTPSKLADLKLHHKSSLHITQGDIRSIPALKACLVRDGRMVDIVVSSIGMTMKREGLSVVSTDPKICEEGTGAVLQALSELEADPSVLKPAGGKKTKIVVLSTTGISDKKDVPCAMMPFYRMLHTPHVDKKKMEEVVVASGRDFVAVRPSFLVDGKRKGLGSLRTSVESVEGGQGEKNRDGDVAVGYTISRADVAGWILDECVIGGEERWNRWGGKMVTITY